jgi:hypothetical protein
MNYAGNRTYAIIPAAQTGTLMPLVARITRDATALKFPGLCGLVSGFGGLVTVWLHVDRGSVTGSGDPRNRTKLLVGTGLSTPCPFTWSFVACQVCHGHRACVHCGRAAGR